ncbi:hypothetical protein E4T43_07449 [Aureobasidium subglaciale]|nr:hypothetical protein E4T43_07449 [Aureobasidium subglaciale]
MSAGEKAIEVSHNLSTTLDRISIAVTGPGRSSKEVLIFQIPNQTRDTGTVACAKLSGSDHDQKQSITSQVLENLSLNESLDLAQESNKRAAALDSDPNAISQFALFLCPTPTISMPPKIT